MSNVTPLFEALIAGDQAQVLVLKNAISKREGQADDIKNELRAHLPNSLFMPVNRTDLLQVLQAQVAIADTSEDIASLLASRKTDVPEVMHEPLMALIKRCVDACLQTKRIIDELDELLEVGFQGREVERIE